MAHHSRDEIETVLVVDDDEFIRKMEVRILNHLGYNVLEAEDPAQAMRLAAATPNIHLLLTDFLMPGADGLQLAAQFHAVHPHIPILMVSGSLPLINARADHPDHFALLEKPFTHDDLVRKVRASLNDDCADELDTTFEGRVYEHFRVAEDQSHGGLRQISRPS